MFRSFVLFVPCLLPSFLPFFLSFILAFSLSRFIVLVMGNEVGICGKVMWHSISS